MVELAARIIVTFAVAVGAAMVVLALIIAAIVSVGSSYRTANERYCATHDHCTDNGR